MKYITFKGLFAESSSFKKFIVAFFCVVFFYFFFSSIGLLILYSTQNSDLGMKLFQLVASLGTFVLSPIAASYLISDDWKDYLSLRETTFKFVILGVVASIVFLPTVSFVTLLNEQMELPGSLQWMEEWMKELETKNQDLTDQFLAVDSFQGFLLNCLVVALIPAVGEELLFRGLIQTAIQRVSKNIHIAIWCSAILFSAIHCQFYGFFPRMLMGVLFGYLLYWSGSIMVPMVCHFLNNFTIVASTYIWGEDKTNMMESIDAECVLYCCISLVLCFIVCKKMALLKKNGCKD